MKSMGVLVGPQTNTCTLELLRSSGARADIGKWIYKYRVTGPPWIERVSLSFGGGAVTEREAEWHSLLLFCFLLGMRYFVLLPSFRQRNGICFTLTHFTLLSQSSSPFTVTCTGWCMIWNVEGLSVKVWSFLIEIKREEWKKNSFYSQRYFVKNLVSLLSSTEPCYGHVS